MMVWRTARVSLRKRRSAYRSTPTSVRTIPMSVHRITITRRIQLFVHSKSTSSLNP